MKIGKEIVESSFLIPLREDRYIGNGRLHPNYRWEWLIDELYSRWGGWHKDPEPCPGGWIDPDTGKREPDDSFKFFVDIKKEDLNMMRSFIKEVTKEFRQKCIRFVCEGKVEYIYQKEDLK